MSILSSGHPHILYLRLRQGERYLRRVPFRLHPRQCLPLFQLLHAAMHAGTTGMLFQEHILPFSCQSSCELAAFHDTTGCEDYRAIHNKFSLS